MNSLIQRVDQLKQFQLLQLVVIYVRYLIGGAFVIAAIGMGKLSSGVYLMQSAQIPIQDLQPIQQFFRVMADSGLYWNFIGWSQIIGGLLLMTQRFAKLGALIFFGLILNIFIITLSYDFKGTPIITGLMLAAASFLVLWDAGSLQYIVRKPTIENLPNQTPLTIADHAYWSILGSILFVVITFSMLTTRNIIFTMGVPLLIGVVALAIFYFMIVRKRDISN
jgi:hypothetical protein